MITERVSSVEEGRADYDELKPSRPGECVEVRDGLHAHASYMVSPEGQEVALLEFDGALAVDDVVSIVEMFDFRVGMHLFVSAESYEKGFDARLHGALESSNLTLMECGCEELSEEARSVPAPPVLAPVPMAGMVTERDIEFLTERFDPVDADILKVLEPFGPDKVPGYDAVGSHWEMFYLFSRCAYAGLMMVRTFITSHGYPSELAQGPHGAWVLLTDFKTSGFKHIELMKERQRELDIQAAIAREDDLTARYLSDSAVKEEEEGE